MSSGPTRRLSGVTPTKEDAVNKTATRIKKVGTVVIPVADQDRAIEFYVDTLGFEVRADVPFGNGYRWVEVAPPGADTTIAIAPPPEGTPTGKRETGIGLQTSDIDAGLPAYAHTLEADLATHGHRVADIEALVLTHSDGDHAGMAATMRDAGVRVLVHRADEPRLRKPGPKSGDGAPIHIVPLLWRPALWRFMGHMARAGGARVTPIADAETFA